MSDTATATGEGTEPTVADVADAFVAAVCRPEDLEAARATVRRVDPVDLGGLVAAVDDHQPMTLEVAVDVLAELGVSPATIATAVGVDHEDVQVLLGAPLGGPPPPLADRDARIIEVVAGRNDPLPDGEADPATIGWTDRVTEGAPGPDVTVVDEAAATEDEAAVRTVETTAGTGAGDDRDAEPTDAAIPPDDARDEVRDEDEGTAGLDEAPVRIESGGDAEESPATVPTLPPNRGRVLWAVVLFVLLIGGMIALAALLGAF